MTITALTVLWALSAISFLVGALAGRNPGIASGPLLSRIDWLLLGLFWAALAVAYAQT